MLQARPENPSHRRVGPGRGTDAGALARVVYRSRAVGEVTPPSLELLTARSQARNSREAITGLMLYDNSRFFQWLEGPTDNVERLMGSISNDHRHTDIEVLCHQQTRTRAFGDWSMKLATPQARSLAAADAIEPPVEVVEDLRRRPDAAPVLLVKLSPVAGRGTPTDAAGAESTSRVPLRSQTAAILRSVILAAVIPQLAGDGAAGSGTQQPPADPRAAELTELLLATDSVAALQLVNEMRAGGVKLDRLYATLFEPAARSLGDLWTEDSCSEFEVTVGLCRLQSAITLLGRQALEPVAGDNAPLVLIAPEPGELHRLGAALHNDVLERAGWSPSCAYPAGDRDLQDLVSERWFDVLDLSLSAAFRRDHRMEHIAETITRARAASRNPGLIVLVGGRMFFEGGAAGQVGADVASRGVSGLSRRIRQAVASGARTVSTTSLPTSS